MGPKKVNARAPHLVLRRMGAPINKNKAAFLIYGISNKNKKRNRQLKKKELPVFIKKQDTYRDFRRHAD